jgi:hypothetical protein
VAEGFVGVVRAFRAAVVAFQPGVYSGEDCAVLVEELATVEKACAAARVRAAARAGACGAHRERGFADVSDWMARATGSSANSAKAALDTASALEAQPEVNAALGAGELSFAQARELVRTEAAVPGSGTELLDLAKNHSLKTLKERARNRRARSIDPEELHALQHQAMHHRHWVTALGTVAYTGELPSEIGVPLMNRIDAETDRLWAKARRPANQQGGESKAQMRRAAIAAEAFVRLVENGGKGKAQAADLVIVCDLRAYRRGEALEDEPCHIVGGGPIPVSLARELGRDAFLKTVLHDGTRIDTIAHFGRRYPAVLRTALDLGAPPDFDGNVCAAPGCDRRYHLQRDHIDPVANGGKTTYTNNQPLCWPHHQVKTDQDRKAGLLRGRPREPD